MTLHNESAKAPTKNFADEPTMASEDELDEEIEAVASIGDGTDDTEPLTEDEIDDEDDEGYF